MKLRINITLVLTLLLIGSIHGQGSGLKGELFLKNGKSVKGYISFARYYKESLTGLGKTAKRVVVRRELKGKKEKYKQSEIDYFTINNDYYTYIPVSRNKESLFRVVEKGKIMLYHREVDDSGPNRVDYYDEYFIKKEGEKVASLITSRKTMKSFRKIGMKYFSDCPSVVKKIENRTYGRREVVLAAKEYNKCHASN